MHGKQQKAKQIIVITTAAHIKTVKANTQHMYGLISVLPVSVCVSFQDDHAVKTCTGIYHQKCELIHV